MDLKGIVQFVKLANKIEKGECIMEELRLQSIITEEQKKQKEKVLKELEGIQKGFELIAPKEKEEKNFDFTKLDLKDISEKQIETDAKGGLEYYKSKGENDIESNYDKKKSEINDKLEKVMADEELGKQKITANAGAQKENVKEDFINKNIIRSSIYQNMMSSIDKEELKELDNLVADTDSKISELNANIQKLDDEKQNALELFNISYAIKLQDEIDKIKKEINNYNVQATKYNNSLLQKEKELKEKYDKQYQDYVDKVEDRNRKVLEFASKYGVSMSNTRLLKQKYEIVKNYLNTLDKQSAYEILNENDDFKNAIGENYFNQLVEEVKSRKY